MSCVSISSAPIESKSFPANLFDLESYPYWNDCVGLIGYCRSSPRRSDSVSDSLAFEWQPKLFRNLASERGLSVQSVYCDSKKTGHSIGPETRPELLKAIERARQTGFPIVAFEWRRFTREPHKLEKYPGVAFVSMVPLSTDPASLDSVCKQEANRYFATVAPERLGGRPRDPTAAFALPFILSQPLGMRGDWSRIAKQLGEGWDGKKVKKILLRYFRYENKLAD